LIITRTPYRISLFGGGTDTKNYFNRWGSLVVGFTIDKYVYVSLRRNHDIFDYKTRVTYSIIESVKDNDKIQNPGVQGTLKHLGITDGLTVSIQGDIPARTGMGSSSSMVVGLVKALDVYKNGRCTLDKNTLAEQAIVIERDVLSEPGGVQDQIWASYGGVNSIVLHKNQTRVRPLPVTGEFLTEFKRHLVLCHTGFSRNSFIIAASYDAPAALEAKHKMLDLARDGLRAFECEYIDDIGQILHRSWLLKRSISTEISNDFINGIYEKGLQSGAVGGKLLGAGGNGFFLFVLHEPDKQQEFCDKLGLTGIDFDYSYGGSEVILHE
jgi:D-glycero-alpha-D-manno-heptose-7-phosphate kinase